MPKSRSAAMLAVIGCTVVSTFAVSPAQAAERSVRARVTNPFAIARISRITSNAFGLPVAAVSSPFAEEAATPTALEPVVSESPEVLSAGTTSTRPPYRPRVRSPFRPPPRPPF